MAKSDADSGERNEYLTTDQRQEAVGALEMTAYFLEQAESDQYMWKWAVIALHNAVQAFMALALRKSTNATVLHRDQRAKKVQAQHDYRQASVAHDAAAVAAIREYMFLGKENLAAFGDLYQRIKSTDSGMLKYTDSQVYKPRISDDQCMNDLNRVRNEFTHFVPDDQWYWLTEFPPIAETGLHVISFLLLDSKNIYWYRGIDDDDLKPRVHVALARANAALSRLSEAYVGLTPPPPPLCGSQDEPS